MEEQMMEYAKQAAEELKRLTAIPSPSGYTKKVTDYLVSLFESMHFPVKRTKKGCVLVDLGGEGKAVGLAAHVDTLGAMVRSVKENGRLRLTAVGGFQFDTADGENATLFTRDGKSYTGQMLNTNPSVHVGKAPERSDETVEMLLDEDVSSKAEVNALGIEVGDFVAADPRTVVTPSGYIKSRFLDDKASSAVLIILAKAAAEQKIALKCHVYLYFTVYEEVGHGCSSGLPEELSECISVDMGCVGEDLSCTERDVSICAKDSAGPYDYELTSRLIRIAKKRGLSYAVDIYPRYGSDVDAALSAGYDLAHGLVGPGVYASHNYERTHIDGLKNTLSLLWGYISGECCETEA